MKLIALALPVLMVIFKFQTGRYIFSALITAACALAALLSGPKNALWLLIAGLVMSIAGDWFMAHQRRSPLNFFFGVGGFGIAHMLFIAYALTRWRFCPWALAAAVALLIGYALYFVLRVYPRIDAPTTAAITVYALLSIAGLYCAFSLNAPMPEKILYILGIASILFSDTMIAESLFLRQKWAGPLILPTYYLCHILLAASRLVR